MIHDETGVAREDPVPGGAGKGSDPRLRGDDNASGVKKREGLVGECEVATSSFTGDASASPVTPILTLTLLYFPMIRCHPREGGDRFPYPHRFVPDYTPQLLLLVR